ncbi:MULTISPECIES: TlpA family protein disulfide reductase [Campylobacter]|uniref:TlpA family protein disulfide reductase n=1 Tax=Campylobacter TaxID=194 RepID=UPI000A347F61|nr:TlpA disulfide reductase family protein [Campylobacter sp. P0024]MCR8679581.1 TlpA family protein disulfide reductase [Campylobacter sp. RM19072]MEE3704914.1 TlpA disulfide reductase family protein [Campylobacter sp. CX2-8023-23]
MKFKIFLAAALLAILTGCNNTSNEESNPTSVIEADYSKPFKLTLNDGSELKMQKKDNGYDFNIKDKAIFLNFFATWCPPCKVEIPYLVSLQEKFKDKLQIIGVSVEALSLEQANEFKELLNINYPIAYTDENQYLISSLGGVVGIPFSILYYPNGKFATSYSGLVPIEMLENDIKKVIE